MNKDRPNTASRIIKSIADQGGIRGDGLHQIDKFRDKTKEKWVDDKDFKVPTS